MAWQTQIKELQQKIIDLGSNLNNSKPIKDLIKEKDNEIHILKKKLKIPNTWHIQYPKYVALQEKRDMIYQEIMLYKEQVAQYKESHRSLEKDKEEILAFKASMC